MKEINVQELYTKMQDSNFESDSVVVDVRVPGEHKSERIASTINIPLNRLEEYKEELQKYTNVYVHCETGGRSGDACKKLQDMMLDNWVNVHGGIAAWKDENLPLLSSTHMSMQRQVMIAAGSLVLIGTILALLINMWIIGIAIFVGAGLVFAGVTNNCGLALVLQKMPWNR